MRWPSESEMLQEPQYRYHGDDEIGVLAQVRSADEGYLGSRHGTIEMPAEEPL